MLANAFIFAFRCFFNFLVLFFRLLPILASFWNGHFCGSQENGEGFISIFSYYIIWYSMYGCKIMCHQCEKYCSTFGFPNRLHLFCSQSVEAHNVCGVLLCVCTFTMFTTISSTQSSVRSNEKYRAVETIKTIRNGRHKIKWGKNSIPMRKVCLLKLENGSARFLLLFLLFFFYGESGGPFTTTAPTTTLTNQKQSKKNLDNVSQPTCLELLFHSTCISCSLPLYYR